MRAYVAAGVVLQFSGVSIAFLGVAVVDVAVLCWRGC